MSEYSYTCACCGKHWHATSTGRKPTKADIARMVCQPCREAPKRIAALEAENAALKERWEKALSEAREAAGHEFGLWPLGAAAITHQLREENARLVEALEDCIDVIEPTRDELAKQGFHDAAEACREVLEFSREAMKGDKRAR